MNNKCYFKYCLYSGLVFLLVFIFSFSSRGVASPDTFNTEESLLEIQEKLAGITEEEKEILEKLFVLRQEIEEIERTEIEISKEIEKLNQEVANIEKLIESESHAYEKNRNVMQEVLKTYQRSGPGSYLEIILSSDNLSTLLQRINILRDITRNTSELLESLEDSKTKLASEKLKVTERFVLMEEQQEELRKILEKNIMLKEGMETYLASLEGEQAKYEEYLWNIEQLWIQLKPLFSETTKAFSNMINEGNLPEDAIKADFSFYSIKGVIEEKTFKDIISKQSFPTALEFEFTTNRLEMIMPEKNIYFSGTFIILEGQKLVFEVDEARFWGMALEKSAIEDLFSNGYLEIDLGPILGKNIIKSIDIYDDSIELQITPVFF